MHDRGQTPQDYVTGIALLLVTLSGVFYTVPGIFDPFQDPIDSTERTMADAAADHLVEVSRVNGTDRTLNYGTLADHLDKNSVDEVKTAAGIPDRKRLNVTVVRGDLDHDGIDEQYTFAGSDRFDETDHSAATAIRIVDLVRNPPGECKQDVCRLVVRVW